MSSHCQAICLLLLPATCGSRTGFSSQEGVMKLSGQGANSAQVGTKRSKQFVPDRRNSTKSTSSSLQKRIHERRALSQIPVLQRRKHREYFLNITCRQLNVENKVYGLSGKSSFVWRCWRAPAPPLAEDCCTCTDAAFVKIHGNYLYFKSEEMHFRSDGSRLHDDSMPR